MAPDQQSPDVDVDPTDGRHETEAERMDRNWDEILQELRVTQTGTQILSGFLLAVAFQPKFAELSIVQRGIYLVLVLTAAVTTALALAPVFLHRGLFRRHRKKLLVQTAHVILRCVLIGVAMVLVGTVSLIFDVALGGTAGWWAAAGMLAVISGLALLPVLLRRSSTAGGSP